MILEHEVAISIGFKSTRWMFSIRQLRADLPSSIGITEAGTVFQPRGDGPQSALSRDQLEFVAPLPHHKRLKKPYTLNRGGQFHDLVH